MAGTLENLTVSITSESFPGTARLPLLAGGAHSRGFPQEELHLSRPHFSYLLITVFPVCVLGGGAEALLMENVQFYYIFDTTQ